MTTTTEKGNLSIHTENIFPIIKKFLYSDHEIFLRELISNAVDATQKLRSLSALGEYNGEIGDTKIKVEVNKELKTIAVIDQGIGMTADDIKKYINQIAFSGATEFVDKYKDSQDVKQLIGHFGLGFYSSFMVAERVKLTSKSFKEGSEAALWVCDGSTQFEIEPTEKAERGTEVLLHIAEDSTEFLEPERIRQILNKYCKFLPVEIEFEGEIINNTNPIWTKPPAELKDEDYLNFYKELYPFGEEPLFWIHLNVDYPFNLTGVLYFPKVKNELVKNSKIQLFSKQVFITDEVRDIVPEFLTLLHGVIDSPDIPLNVSRSFLQADGNVKKINSYITKKVADKLSDLFKADRAAYEEKWSGIDVFVKFGIITDDKFLERAEKFVLIKDTQHKLFTLEEYREQTQTTQTDKDGGLVWLYSHDAAKQDQFIQSAKKRAYSVLLFEGVLDHHFINTIERRLEKTQFKRVDADSLDKIIDKGTALETVLNDTEKETLKTVFKEISKREDIDIQALPTDEMPVTLTMPEFFRRMRDMAKLNGEMGYFSQIPEQVQVTINGNHAYINKMLQADAETQKKLAKHAYDLALLSQNMLSGAEMTAFLHRSLELIDK